MGRTASLTQPVHDFPYGQPRIDLAPNLRYGWKETGFTSPPIHSKKTLAKQTMRPQNRAPDQLRPVRITRRYTKHAEGSVLIECGDTQIICTASVERQVPRWLKGRGQGWITAEYGMLPRATGERTGREAARGKQGGRTMEIQRLIGRSLRAAYDLKALDGYTLTVDCDVIQADGGTRTAAVTGGFVALMDAIDGLKARNAIIDEPLIGPVAAVSVGVVAGRAILDLEYEEDCAADADMNVVMNTQGKFIEVQGTAEGAAFTMQELQTMLTYADQGIRKLIQIQRQTRDQGSLGASAT